MSNTIYIDASTSNAIKINETNNRFTYRFPNAIELPTGTEIALQNSIINLKGITGASIEIEEDIEERMIYQYHSMDTSYMVPTSNVVKQTAAANNYQILIDHGKNFNRNREFPNVVPDADLLGQPYIDQTNNALAGYSEVPMPLLAQYEHGDGTMTAVPALGVSTIKIPKGVYSIDKLSTLITEQINNIDTDNPATPLGNKSETFYTNQKFLNQYSGYIANNSTVRNFTVEEAGLWKEMNDEVYTNFGKIKNLQPIAIETPPIVPDGNTIPGAIPPNFISLTQRTFPTLDIIDINAGLCSVIGVSAETNERVRFNAMRGGFGAGTNPHDPTQPRVREGCNFKEITKKTGDLSQGNGKYFRGWEKLNNLGGTNGKELVFIDNDYDIFRRGIAFGADNFSISYEPKGGFAFNYLHQPRKITSCSKNGVANANAGQECIYKKDPCTEFYDALRTNPGGTTQNVTAGVQALTSLMTKFSGLLVTNFAFDTARRLGDLTPEKPNKLADADATAGNIIACQQYAYFSEFFSSEAKAKAAWDTTLWSRLGFTYEDLASPLVNYAEKAQYSMYNVTRTVAGFTTFQDIDSSLLSTMSTIYNPLNLKPIDAQAPTPGTDRVGPLPGVNNVQVFNLSNTNLTNSPFSNKIVDDTGPLNAAAYNSSFYDQATMIPAVTKGRPYTADRLPTLSKNGYLLVTSDLVESTDIMKNQQNDGILDLIPKSNLSNQDYMSDRNILTHTLSNPKSVNEVTINILNPDLTDISLEPNTTCLLRITTPIPKPTQYIAKVAENVAEQQVANVIARDIEMVTDPKVADVNGRIDNSNIVGQQGRGDGIDPSDVDRARDELEVEEALQGQPVVLPEAPPEDAGDAPIQMPDMPAEPDEPDAPPQVPQLLEGEEPQPNPEDPPQRPEEVKEAQRTLQSQAIALTERLERLEREHRAEQAQRGVAVGRGRKPKAQKNTLLAIKNTQAALDRVEDRLRGFYSEADERENLARARDFAAARGDEGKYLALVESREETAGRLVAGDAGRNAERVLEEYRQMDPRTLADPRRERAFRRQGGVRKLKPIPGQRRRARGNEPDPVDVPVRVVGRSAADSGLGATPPGFTPQPVGREAADSGLGYTPGFTPQSKPQ